MCFSATASFVSGGALLMTGTYLVSLTRAKGQQNYLALASIPLFFGIQQILEGMVWIELTKNTQSTFLIAISLGYLFFALFFWPTWIPFSCYMIEESLHQRWFKYTAIAGFISGLVFYLPIAWQAPTLNPQIVCSSIQYLGPVTKSGVEISLIGKSWYTLVTLLPILFSSNLLFAQLGLLITALFLLSHWIFNYAFLSVWCFFTAIASLSILHIIRKLPHQS
jgi:hypothetical protein